MKERPIIFSGAMVRAILAGNKTQTRRVVNPSLHPKTNAVIWNTADNAFIPWYESRDEGCRTGKPFTCPYGAPGDRLWVRETWQTTTTPKDRDTSKLVFAADYDGARPGFVEDEWLWRPSIYMPRWSSRITLEVTEVRVQRLQDISEDDIIAESATVDAVARATGIPWSDLPTLHSAWEVLWNNINGDRAPWSSNPWVWAVSFKRVLP